MRSTPVKSYFLVHEVEHFTGFTKHMLDYLAREDIFAPSESKRDERGVQRRYSYADVVLLRALHSICKGKGKIRHLKDSLLNFRMTVGRIKPGMRLQQLLFVEGDELCLRTSSEGALVLHSGQMMLASVVDLSAVTTEIAQGVIVEKGDAFRLTAAADEAAQRIRQEHWKQVQEWRRKRKEREARAASKAA